MAPPNPADLALTLQPRTSLTFEFIDVEDKDARRKARSHVIREAKQRQKLETLRFQKNKEGTKRSLAPAVSRTKVLQPVLQETSVVAAKAVNFLPSISTVLEGLIDPFNQFPVKLTSGKDLGLVDHYYTTFRPKPFLLSDCDYTPVKKLMLQVSMQDAASFLVIISGAANDIAMRSGRTQSQQSIEYKSQAMTLVNKRMAVSQSYFTDGTINACSMFAGTELLFGTPETFNTHMDGVMEMLKSRGGYDKLQQTNPLLASLLAWHDFAGAAALACHRRFAFTSCDPHGTSSSLKPVEYTAPFNIPRDTLPPNYTLYDDLMILLENLENATTLIRAKSMDKSKLEQHTNFVAKLNSDLIRILSPPTSKTTPFRRFLIEDSFRLACLIYISAICRSYGDWESQSNVAIEELKGALLNDCQSWSVAVEMLARFLLGGGKAMSQRTVHYVEQLMKLFVPMDWCQWKSVRDMLLAHFLSADMCAGPLQDLWRCRIDL
ncbi:fungal-specific transcription factor domain-containing protein [Leptodontidium sp. 2 PMI_412]|nr:fungal-specific transcription factor domain-containing protein [Leptodontidium sp. 2 PMI_412]